MSEERPARRLDIQDFSDRFFGAGHIGGTGPVPVASTVKNCHDHNVHDSAQIRNPPCFTKERKEGPYSLHIQLSNHYFE